MTFEEALEAVVSGETKDYTSPEYLDLKVRYHHAIRLYLDLLLLEIAKSQSGTYPYVDSNLELQKINFDLLITCIKEELRSRFERSL